MASELRALRASPHVRSIQEFLWQIHEAFDGQVLASSSFGVRSAVLLHLLHETTPDTPVVFIDTGQHFPETLAYRDQLEAELSLNVRTIEPDEDVLRWADRLPGTPCETRPDQCCQRLKVEPMERSIADVSAWIAGIRREQTPQRRSIRRVQRRKDGVYKIHPLWNWTGDQMDRYMKEHGLPEHPLRAEGYRSIGCAPTTRPVAEDEDDRAGRWPGQDRTECGLHSDVL